MTAATDSTTYPKRTRNTIQRRAVLEAVRAIGDTHPTAADVFAEVRRTTPNLSLATVYRALDALVAQKEIGRGYVENVARYDVSASPHHHIVCRGCGCVVDMQTSLPTTTIRRLQAASNGFSLDLDSIQFSGVCPTCSRSEK